MLELDVAHSGRDSASVTTHSAISVVSALASGRGVTIGIAIPCAVEVQRIRGGAARQRLVVDSAGAEDSHGLVRTCVLDALNHLSQELAKTETLFVKIRSAIPPAVGLKSSSAVSAAVVKAVLELYSDGVMDADEVLKISCSASIEAGASITGAYDDAAASLLGGLVFADNPKFKILKRASFPTEKFGSIVLLLVPERKKRFTSSIDTSRFAHQKKESLEAFQYALHGDVSQAMFLNSIVQCLALGYRMRPITTALSGGATAAGISGKGPTVAAICLTDKQAERVGRIWQDQNPDCRVLRTGVWQGEENPVRRK